MFRFTFFLSILVTCGVTSLQAQSTGTGPNLLAGDFESGLPTYNPWAGVDDLGNLHVIAGTQLAVSDTGSVGAQGFSPSVSVGDLDGDGLKDLVVADARGFFWFFRNSGKADAPNFTHGEVMPIWLGGGENEGDAVPRIQLIDFTGDRKLSIVAGNYFGGLYYLRNTGSASSPNFRMPQDRASIQVPTRKQNVLWCNYLAPFLFDWSGQNRLDLTMGDGSYSANSIYLLTNRSNNDRPMFNEDFTQKLIPGMGREHLTPQVVDWNNDGKPDIITGERVGYISVYLNQAKEKGDAPVFDMNAPQHVMFGTSDKIGTLTTVSVADLNNDGLFDLTVGSADGRILYALNTGTAGNPKFGAPVPYKGINQYPKIIKPRTWALDRYRPDGAPYELLECTNATVEKDFVPLPEDFKGKGAMKFSVVKPQNVFFPDFYEPQDMTRVIRYFAGVNFDIGVRYILSFLMRTEGNISNLTYRLEGSQTIGGDPVYTTYTGQSMGSGGGSWSRVSQEIRLPNAIRDNPERKPEKGGFVFRLNFEGNGSLYLDDISLKKAQQ